MPGKNNYRQKKVKKEQQHYTCSKNNLVRTRIQIVLNEKFVATLNSGFHLQR